MNEHEIEYPLNKNELKLIMYIRKLRLILAPKEGESLLIRAQEVMKDYNSFTASEK